MSLPSARPMVESGLCNVRSTGAPSDGKKRIVAMPRARLMPHPTNDNACRGLYGHGAGGMWLIARLLGDTQQTSSHSPSPGELGGSNSERSSDAKVRFLVRCAP